MKHIRQFNESITDKMTPKDLDGPAKDIYDLYEKCEKYKLHPSKPKKIGGEYGFYLHDINTSTSINISVEGQWYVKIYNKIITEGLDTTNDVLVLLLEETYGDIDETIEVKEDFLDDLMTNVRATENEIEILKEVKNIIDDGKR